MKYSELKRSLSAGVMPVYVICGADDFLRNYAVDMIVQKCVSMPELNYMSAQGENIDPSAWEGLYASLRSYPFLSEKRAVLLREYYPSADELKRYGLANYLDDPQDSSVLIFNNKKECKSLDKFQKIVKVDCTSELALCIGWICNEAKKASLGISSQTAETIAKYCLLDFTKINAEIKKLIDYCADIGTIDMQSVNDIVYRDSEYRIYEMTEAIAANRFDEAYSIINKLLNENESEQKLFSSIYSHYRRMLFVAISGDDFAALAEMLGVKEYAVKMTKKQASKFSVNELKEVCSKLAAYDSMVKAGDVSLSNALWNGVFSAMIK